MFKIANQVIDAYDDIYWNHLEKVAQKRPETYIMTPNERCHLGDDDYALCYITKEATKLQKFPINSFDNTFLANEIYPETYHRLEKNAAEVAATFIKKACEQFKIQASPTVINMASDKVESNVYVEPTFNTKIASAIVDAKALSYLDGNTAEKTASIDGDKLKAFAEVDNICNNPTHAQYVFATPNHVKLACQYFHEKHEKMPLESRSKYAAAIQVRAKELGMGEQKGTVAKYASDAYSGMLDAHLSSRKRLIEGGAYESDFAKIASAKANLTPNQFAQMLYAFDKKAGLNKYYGGYLTDPFQSTFAQNDSSYMWMNKKGSRALTAAEIESVVGSKNEKIAEYFGKGVADSMKTHPVAIFDSLPNDCKEIIANIHDGLL